MLQSKIVTMLIVVVWWTFIPSSVGEVNVGQHYLPSERLLVKYHLLQDLESPTLELFGHLECHP